jgi:site-specific DNA-methyltransferase (adenine-specific)
MKFPEDFINKVIHGDCLEVMRQMPDKCVDLVLTDPPYEISDSQPGASELMSLGKYNSKDFGNVTIGFSVEETLGECLRLCKGGCNMFVFCSNKQISKIMGWGEKKGFYTTLLVWNKNNAAPFANGVWRQDAEFIVHIRESGAYFQGDAEIKKKVTIFPTNASQFGHPTEKPVELIKKFITIGSKEGDLIFDPFGGSCTTAVACKQMNRKYICIEKEAKYVSICNERLAQDMLF